MEHPNYVFKLLEKYDYDWDKIWSAVSSKEFVRDAEVEQYNHYTDFITLPDDNYPLMFAVTATPPFAIFHDGSPNLDPHEVPTSATQIALLQFLTDGDLDDHLLSSIAGQTFILDTSIPSYNTLVNKLTEVGAKVMLFHSCGRDNPIWDEFKYNDNVIQLTFFLDHTQTCEKYQRMTYDLVSDILFQNIVVQAQGLRNNIDKIPSPSFKEIINQAQGLRNNIDKIVKSIKKEEKKNKIQTKTRKSTKNIIN